MTARVLAFALFALFALPACDPVRADTTVLPLDAGPALRNGDGAYKGIPYAAPPVGALRWKTAAKSPPLEPTPPL